MDDGLIFDAVRLRLIEIGEAVKAIDGGLLARETEVQWVDVAGMRDRLAHRHFDTSHAIVLAMVERDLPILESGVNRLRAVAEQFRVVGHTSNGVHDES
jgi:uncharacterized protein with HEPN domain